MPPWPCEPLLPAGTGTHAVHYALNASATELGLPLPVHQHHTANWSAPCFLMPLRDPAGRLESGVRFELLHPTESRPRLTRFRSAQALVDGLRRADPAATRLLALSRNKTSPSSDGSFFLTNQSFYLARLPDAASVLFVCDTTLRRDLALVTRDPHWDADAPASFRRSAVASENVTLRSALRPADAQYMRRLFADDAALVCRECGVACHV